MPDDGINQENRHEPGPESGNPPGDGGGSADGFRQQFVQQLARPEEDLDLGRAALLLAGEEYPGLEVAARLGELDAMAAVVAGRLGVGAGPDERAAALAHYLFDELGFNGNAADYYNPDNSYFNRVLDTRTGIPITLSLLFLEVGRRVGLRGRGVGLPGHFLVRLEETGQFIDPFHGGAARSAADCRALVEGLFGARLTWTDDYLLPCTKYEFLFRMLNNLKVIYQRRRDYPKAAGALQRMLLVHPQQAGLYQELAQGCLEMGQYRQAIVHLETYLRQTGQPPDAARVRQNIAYIRHILDRLN